MRGWLLVSERSNEYKKKRLLEEAQHLGIDLQLVYPRDFAVSVHSGTAAILFKGDILKEFTHFLISLIVIEHYDSYAFKILTFLESKLTIPNTVTAVRNANDKVASYDLLAQHHISIPKTILISPEQTYTTIESHLTPPFVVKPNYGLKGEAVELIHSDTEWQTYFAEKKGTFVAQEYIQESHGTDLRIIVMGNEIVGAMKRSSAGELTSNIATGGSAVTVEVSPELQQLALQSARAVGLGFGSIDFLYGKNGPVVCEVNANPGFTAFEATTGINLAGKLLEWCRDSQ